MLICSFSLYSYCNNPIVSLQPSAIWVPQAVEEKYMEKKKQNTNIFKNNTPVELTFNSYKSVHIFYDSCM